MSTINLTTVCALCGYTSPKLYMLHNHMRTFHSKFRVTCPKSIGQLQTVLANPLVCKGGSQVYFDPNNRPGSCLDHI